MSAASYPFGSWLLDLKKGRVSRESMARSVDDARRSLQLERLELERPLTPDQWAWVVEFWAACDRAFFQADIALKRADLVSAIEELATLSSTLGQARRLLQLQAVWARVLFVRALLVECLPPPLLKDSHELGAFRHLAEKTENQIKVKAWTQIEPALRWLNLELDRWATVQDLSHWASRAPALPFLRATDRAPQLGKLAAAGFPHLHLLLQQEIEATAKIESLHREPVLDLAIPHRTLQSTLTTSSRIEEWLRHPR